MKSLIFAAILGLAGIAGADQIHTNAFIPTRDVQSCNFWTYHSHQNASSGYLCSGSPMRVEVPDAWAVNQAFTQLEMRIQQLEARVAALEKKP